MINCKKHCICFGSFFEREKYMKKVIIIFSFLVLIFSALMLTGCQSTDETESYMGTGYNFTYNCSYDYVENQTTIKIKSYIQNDTIYTIYKVTLNVNLYNNDILVKREEKVTFDFKVKYGTKKDFNFSTYYTGGKVNKVEYVSWTASYKSVWGSYMPWFISAIVIASIIAIAFILIMIIADLEFEDVVDFLGEHLWVIPSILIGFIPYIISGISSGSWSWIPPIIIGGGILSIVLVCLIALGIKYSFTYYKFDSGIGLSLDGYGRIRNSNPTITDGDGNEYYIDDLLDNEEALMAFSKEDLVDWCRENELTGYSKLNKNDLVALIMNSKNDDSNNESSKSEKKTVKITKTSANKKGISFDDIVGLETAKTAFKEKVIMPMKHKELYEKFGKRVGGGILLYGLPGTGKTMFAEAVSNELDVLFIPVKCSDIKSKWYGESEQKVKEIFNKARKAKNAIIFFDEFEAIGAKRIDNSDNGNNDLVPEILAQMQGIGSNKSDSMILFIAATNKPWSIDSAFLRPGRFDEKIYIPLPDFEARKKLFELQLSKLPHEDDLDFDLLANLTEGCNGADIKDVCEKLKMSAINDSITTGQEQTIGMDDIEKIKDSIKSSVQAEDIEKLEEFQNS